MTLCIGGQLPQAHRTGERTGADGRGGAAHLPQYCQHRCRAQLPLARPGHGAGPALDQLRMRKALPDACLQVADSHVLAQAGEGPILGGHIGHARRIRGCRSRDLHPVGDAGDREDWQPVGAQLGGGAALEGEFDGWLANRRDEELAVDAACRRDRPDPPSAEDRLRGLFVHPYDRQRMAPRACRDARSWAEPRRRAVDLKGADAKDSGEVVADDRGQALVTPRGDGDPPEVDSSEAMHAEHSQDPVGIGPDRQASLGQVNPVPRLGAVARADNDVISGRLREGQRTPPCHLPDRLGQRGWRQGRGCRQETQRVQGRVAQSGGSKRLAVVEPWREPLGDPPKRPERVAARAWPGRVRGCLAGEFASPAGRHLALVAVPPAAQWTAEPVEAEAPSDCQVTVGKCLARSAWGRTMRTWTFSVQGTTSLIFVITLYHGLIEPGTPPRRGSQARRRRLPWPPAA